MKIENKGHTSIIEIEASTACKNIVGDLSQRMGEDLKAQNIIINLLERTMVSIEDLEVFLPLSQDHNERSQSFVLVSNSVNHNDVPAELHVVPTLQEAQDIIDMEEIERDLGF